MPRIQPPAATLLLLAGLAMAPIAIAQDTPQTASQPAPPTGPPPSPGPALPEDAAAQLNELSSRLARAQEGIIAESGTTANRRALLQEAIEAAGTIVQVREAHQGNAPTVRWRNSTGEPAPWHELATARAVLEDLTALQDLDDQALSAWAQQRIQRSDATRVRTEGRTVDARNLLRALLIEAPERTGLAPDRLEWIEAERELALLQQNLGEPIDAEIRFRSVATTYENRLGPEHPTTLDAINTHALVLNAMGDVENAQKMFDRVHAARAHVLGSSHPATLVALLNSGFADVSRGRPGEALPRFDRAYDGLRTALGEADPTTLVAAEARGVALQRLDRLDEALVMYLGVENGRRAVLGPEHLETLRAAANVATILARQNRLAEAAFRFNVVTEGRRRQLGEGHPLYLASLGELADTLLTQGNLETAASFAQRAQESWRITLGDQHPQSIGAIERLARIRLAQGRAEEALAMFSTARTLREEIGAADTDAGRSTLIDLAGAALATGNAREAITTLERARDDNAADLGPDHPLTTEARRALAGAYLRSGDDRAEAAARPLIESGTEPALQDEALHAIASRSADTLERLLDRSREQLGPTAATTRALAHAFALTLADEDPRRAEALLEGTLDAALSVRPERDPTTPAPSTLTIAGDLARLLIEDNRPGEAFDLVQRARAHAAFDAIVCAGADRALLRAALADNALRTEYERLLTAETNARTTANEAELRASELRERTDGALETARQNLARASSNVLSHVRTHAPALGTITHAELTSRLGETDAYLDILATPDSLIAMWVTSDGVDARVVTADRERITTLGRTADRVRTWTINPDAPDPRDMSDLTTLRLGLIPTDARRLVNQRTVAYAISNRFAHVPMGLLLPNAALARVATPASALHAFDRGADPSTLVITTTDASEPAPALDAIDAFASAAVTRFPLANSDANTLRAQIATTSPTHLHLDLPIWADAQAPSSAIADYAAAPTAFDVLETMGPRARQTRLIVAPSSRSFRLDNEVLRRDTLGPTLTLGGVRTVLYTLWAGDPTATALMTARFYANTEGHNAESHTAPGPALRDAQRWLRSLTQQRIDEAIASGDFTPIATDTDAFAQDATGERPYAHPYFWSNATLSGAPWRD